MSGTATRVDPPCRERTIGKTPRSAEVATWTRESAPEGIRTPNLLIRSQMLYPLSYGRPPRHAVRR
jgi:hypothetical protein